MASDDVVGFWSFDLIKETDEDNILQKRLFYVISDDYAVHDLNYSSSGVWSIFDEKRIEIEIDNLKYELFCSRLDFNSSSYSLQMLRGSMAEKDTNILLSVFAVKLSEITKSKDELRLLEVAPTISTLWINGLSSQIIFLTVGLLLTSLFLFFVVMFLFRSLKTSS
jgi:ABC-type multidrug transport system permease subunit